jgi:hypothetical protein
MSKFYNNVKSRLNKKGLSGFKKEDYLKAAEYLGIVDLDNVTTDQIIAGVEYLTNQRTSQLVVVSDEDTPNLIASEDTNLIDHKEHETHTQEEGEENTLNPVHPSDEGQLTISNADKQSLVATQSSALGFELSEQETVAIADSIDDVFSDYSSFISSVTIALKGYITHKFDEIENDLDNSSNDVRDYLADRNLRVKEKLSNYAASVKSIQSDSRLIREGLKASQQSILSRFRT